MKYGDAVWMYLLAFFTSGAFMTVFWYCMPASKACDWTWVITCWVAFSIGWVARQRQTTEPMEGSK